MIMSKSKCVCLALSTQRESAYMARSPLMPRSGMEQVPITDRSGFRNGRAGVTLTLRSGIALATVAARRNQLDALVDRLREVFGLHLVELPRCVIAGPIRLVWVGPGHWL